MVTKPHFVGSAGFPARDASRGWMPRRGARTRATGQGGRAPKQGLIALVTVLATIYNALLAFLAAQGGPATMGIVIAFELLVLLSALGLVASVSLHRQDVLPLVFLYFTVLVALLSSLVAETPFMDSVRNILIIAAFTMLGTRSAERTIRLAFNICTALTLAVLLLEIISVETYASLFRPGDYLAKTRGYAVKEFYEDTGLSMGTIVYEGRFSFGLFDGPRTSSIFLEQVGINCFAIVTMVYLTTMWDRVSRWEKLLGVGTVALIILSNNARMASLLVPIYVVGYFVFPRLPRHAIALIPVALFLGAWILFQFKVPEHGDDLIGRLAVSYLFISDLNAHDLLFGNHELAQESFDTGYGYVLASATIFGALAYWAFLTLVVPQKNAMQRRCAWGMAIYIYLWLLVGGTGSFSIKTAALLWLLIGFVRIQSSDAEPAGRRVRGESGRAGLIILR